MTNIVSVVSRTSAWLAVVTSLLGVMVESKPAAAKTSDTLDLRMPDVQPQAVSQSAAHVPLQVRGHSVPMGAAVTSKHTRSTCFYIESRVGSWRK